MAQTDVPTRDDATAPLIRAALGLDLMETKVTLPKGGSVFNPVKNKEIKSYSKNAEFSLRFHKGKISVSGLNDLYSSVIFTPAENSFLKYNNKEYRGYVRAVAMQSGIWIVNHVEMEEYLYGVVPFEVPMSWNIEAIKAQAVAARTYAVRCLSQYPHGEFDVYDTVKDQVYGGVSGEKESSIAAVEGSRGIILSYQGWPIKAYYSADAGGQTEDGKYVFPGDLPYLKSVTSYDDLERHRWHFVMKKSELQSVLKKSGKDVGTVKEVRIKEISPTGRPRTVEIVGSNRTHQMSSNDFRKMIGAGRIRSTLFTIEGKNSEKNAEISKVNSRTVSISDKSFAHVVTISGSTQIGLDEAYVLGSNGIGELNESSIMVITADMGKTYTPKVDVRIGDDELLFVGSGFGHGVGMSQWGAKACADMGWDYKTILLHFYQGAELSIWY